MMSTVVGREYSANERVGSCERPRGRNFCLGGKPKERLGLRKVLEMNIWVKGHSSKDFCRHSVGRGPGGYQRNFSGSSSKVSQTSTGATTARSV